MKHCAQLRPAIIPILSHFNPLYVFTPRFSLHILILSIPLCPLATFAEVFRLRIAYISFLIFQHPHCVLFSSVLTVPYFPASSLCLISQRPHCALFSSVHTVPHFPASSLCLIFQCPHGAFFPSSTLCPIFQRPHCALFSSVLTMPYSSGPPLSGHRHVPDD